MTNNQAEALEELLGALEYWLVGIGRVIRDGLPDEMDRLKPHRTNLIDTVDEFISAMESER